ncbi:hypothetical protein OS493_037978 [Desmophyllum pertusum]|uniref:Orotidine 5'-phosphate decarboxylase n=1 Tax=Desmophyllum pertusum TaxID=174260 RepID=A0A9X0D176_9CNID|nr:hypothetical protein OS493_037978 [Desmophyllum pertusum]
MLQAQGVKLHSLLTLPEVLDVLLAKEKVNPKMAAKVREFLSANKFQPSATAIAKVPTTPGSKLSFEARAQIATNPLTRKLFEVMHKKRSNLAVSVDFTTCGEVLSLVDKTHVDILEDFTPDLPNHSKAFQKSNNFVIFEDRKFADIGNTVKNQYSKGLYHIAEWADLVNAHVVPGDGVVKGLKEVGAPLGRACLLIGEMSSAGSLATGEYTKAAVEMAKEHKDFVIGFISLSCLVDDPQFVHMTPGVTA